MNCPYCGSPLSYGTRPTIIPVCTARPRCPVLYADADESIDFQRRLVADLHHQGSQSRGVHAKPGRAEHNLGELFDLHARYILVIAEIEERHRGLVHR